MNEVAPNKILGMKLQGMVVQMLRKLGFKLIIIEVNSIIYSNLNQI